MATANKTWVCATCGQGVTRRSSGFRHINKLHSGKEILVRPYVYVAGIVSGRFQQSDPSLYRNHTKEEFSKRSLSATYSQPQFGGPLTKIVHEQTNRYSTEAGTRPFSNINDKDPGYSFPLVESGDHIDRSNPTDSIQVMIRRKQTLQEIEKLARKYYAPNIANGIITTAQSMVLLEDDKSLHTTLEYLKRIARSQPPC